MTTSLSGKNLPTPTAHAEDVFTADEIAVFHEAFYTFPKEIGLTIASALLERAWAAGEHAKNAETEAEYLTPEKYRERWLESQKEAYALWDVACSSIRPRTHEEPR